MLCLRPISDAKVILENVKISSAARGKWATIQISLKNEASHSQKANVEIKLGDLKKGLEAHSYEVFVPPLGKRVYTSGIFIPHEYKPPQKMKLHKKMSNVKKIRKKTRRPKRHMRFTFEAILKVNGVLQKKEVFYGVLQSPHTLRLQYEFHRPSEDRSNDVLFHKKNDFNWSLKRYSHFGNLHQIQTISKLRTNEDAINHTELKQIKLLYLDTNVKRSLSETQHLLAWCKEGGVLFMSPTSEVNTLHQQTGLIPVSEIWSEIHKKRWSLQLPLSKGQLYHQDQNWQSLFDDQQIPILSYRDYGFGKIIGLNFNLESLVHQKDDVQEKLLNLILPNNLQEQSLNSTWPEHIQSWLNRSNGFKVWSKSFIAIFLLSFICVSILILYSPLFKKSQERKWGAWSLSIIVWTILALVSILLDRDRSTKISNSKIALYQDDQALEIGSMSVISGSKRQFPLLFDRLTNWSTGENRVWSKEINHINDSNSWTNFSLRPGEQTLIHYHRHKVQAAPAQINLNLGKQIKLELPDAWTGNPIALVIGRRCWLTSAKPNNILKMDQGKLLSQIPDDHELGQQLIALCRSPKQSILPKQRIWVAILQHDSTLPCKLPDDVLVQHSQLSIHIPTLKFIDGPALLSEGMSSLSFLKGRVNPQETRFVKYHDGVFYKELPQQAKVTSIFRPILSQTHFKIQKIHLQYNFSGSKDSTFRVSYLNSEGKYRPLRTNLEGRIQVPLQAYHNQKVVMQIRPTRIVQEGLKQKTWSIKDFELSFNGSIHDKN